MWVQFSCRSDGRCAMRTAIESRIDCARCVLVVLALFLLQGLGFGRCQSFCLNSRSTCPDVKTFDELDLKAYAGRWYEIGSNAYFKNLQETGGTCVSATYSLLEEGGPDRGAVIKVVNSQTEMIGPLAKLVVRSVSFKAGQICQQARQICTAIQPGSISQGLAVIHAVAENISAVHPTQSESLLKSKGEIETALDEINTCLDILASNVSQLQILDSQLSQGDGAPGDHIAALETVAAQGSAEVDSILSSLSAIRMARKDITDIAGFLFSIGSNDSESALQLFGAASLIQSAEESIPGPASAIDAALAGAANTATNFAYDTTGPTGVSALGGQAIQNLTYPGRLAVVFDNVPGPPGDYWILAVEGKASEGYDAALVYACHERPGGGVNQAMFVLSRKPTIAEEVLKRFMNLATSLSVTHDCEQLLVSGLQPESCQYPA